MASNPPTGKQASAATIIATLLLPPLGIYLSRGIGSMFWIGTVLTCIGIVPGIVFALAVVLGFMPARRSGDTSQTATAS